MAYILSLDAGTTSVRAILFDTDGRSCGVAQKEIRQIYPRPGWVEHDAEEIWESTRRVVAQVMKTAKLRSSDIAAVGITNQRETTVVWDRRNGKPLGNAIVWQDRRTAGACDRLRSEGRAKDIQKRTGLIVDAYFSGTKIAWALDEWPRLRAAGDDLAIGTIESWLVWKLTGGAHLTDASNASRTLLMGLGTGRWDDGLIDLFGVPRASLGEIVDNAGDFGTTDAFGGSIPIRGLAGDQQAATIGQACLKRGEVKATYGTGAFVLANCGASPPASRHRLLSTVLWQLDGRRAYALEGSVFVAGSLMQWLRDSVGLIETAAESEALARGVEDNGGVYCVPALAGIGAPWWEAEARAALTGMSFSTTRAHIVRACLEAMAHQTHDLQTAFAADGAAWACLRIDGGMVANDWMAQDLADMLDLDVERPGFAETTALGAAMLAGVGCGWFADLAAAAAMRGETTRFRPAIAADAREERLKGWSFAVETVVAAARR